MVFGKNTTFGSGKTGRVSRTLINGCYHSGRGAEPGRGARVGAGARHGRGVVPVADRPRPGDPRGGPPPWLRRGRIRARRRAPARRAAPRLARVGRPR